MTLKQYMDKHGVTPYKLAKVSGMSNHYLYQQLKQNHDMRLSTAIKLKVGMAKLTGYEHSLDDMFGEHKPDENYLKDSN